MKTNQYFNTQDNRRGTMAQWASALSLQAKRCASWTEKRIVFCDYSYRSAELATKLHKITDSEMVLCGTVRINSIEGPSREYIKRAISQIETRKEIPFLSYMLSRNSWKELW